MNAQYAVKSNVNAIAILKGKRLYANNELAALIELPWANTKKVEEVEAVLLSDEDGKVYKDIESFSADFDIEFDGVEYEVAEEVEATPQVTTIDWAKAVEFTTNAELKRLIELYTKQMQRAPLVTFNGTVVVGKERNEKGTKKWIETPRAVVAIIQKVRVKWLFCVVDGKMLYAKSVAAESYVTFE